MKPTFLYSAVISSIVCTVGFSEYAHAGYWRVSPQACTGENVATPTFISAEYLSDGTGEWKNQNNALSPWAWVDCPIPDFEIGSVQNPKSAITGVHADVYNAAYYYGVTACVTFISGGGAYCGLTLGDFNAGWTSPELTGTYLNAFTNSTYASDYPYIQIQLPGYGSSVNGVQVIY